MFKLTNDSSLEELNSVFAMKRNGHVGERNQPQRINQQKRLNEIKRIVFKYCKETIMAENCTSVHKLFD